MQTPSRWRQALLPAVALLAMTLIAYGPALRAGFIWDDPDYVTNNTTLRTLDGLRQIWLVPRATPQYYPLVHTSFWIEYRLWGLNPAGYHTVNVLLHAAGAILLWRVLRQLEMPGAFIAAAIFALHPVHVESVAWVTERKNVLSAVFYLAAALAYLKSGFGFRVSGVGEDTKEMAASSSSASPETRHPKPDTRYLLSLGLFVCALLSKTVTASLPAAILLVVWWKRGRIGRRDVLPLVPMFVIGVALALNTARLERVHVGASGAEFDFSALDRLLIAGRAVWFYAWKLIAPVNLSFIYPRWRIDDRNVWQYLFPAAAAALVIAMILLRRRIGRGPVVAILFFGGTLVPALGFFNVYPMRYSFVADHFAYHASIGLIALIAAAVAPYVKQWSVIGAVLLIVLGVLTFLRTRVYESPLTLWQDTVEKNPNSWMVHTNLADALMNAGQVEQGEAQYRRAYELAPQLAETNWNVGVMLSRNGRYQEALAQFDKAIAISPEYPQPHYSRGLALLALGRHDEAEAAFRRAIALNPGYAEAHFQLGYMAEQRNDPQSAIDHYTQAVRRRLDYELAHYNLANVLLSQRRPADAIVHYSQVLRINPRRADAHTNLGAALLQLGQVDQAILAFRTALAIDPMLTPAQRGLEQAMRLQGSQ